MKIAIIDIIGIPYDGTTVFKQGLGGSESAVILMSRELSRIGLEVTVFNTCDLDHAVPGTYDGVNYRPLADLSLNHQFDIVISSRTVIPFADPIDYSKLNDHRAYPFAKMDLYNRILSKAKLRILWQHDTFCLGDNILEELAVSNRITDIFALSDWHLTYVANCAHGRRRNFEVLKNKYFLTRNGVHNYFPEVDIKSKDRDLFVYNASVTKGMIPLVKQIWPHVKRHIPSAKLKIIGGYYRFSQSSQPDQQEKDWRMMADDPAYASQDIEFLGVIPQKQIAEILCKANFMIYPAAFPETYGISTTESILYNTPVITCRFGALEEIALDMACYKIDYAIEPNNLFPDINIPRQVEQFVKTVVEAYRNPYLHQQKQYYCNVIKDIAGWDSVALQWKQFFYKKIGLYFSRKEYRSVAEINHKIHRIYGRRYHNLLELDFYKSNVEQPIVVVSTFYNCKDYIVRCIDSVASQDYENYQHILVDDASTDETLQILESHVRSLPENIRSKFVIVSNTENLGAVYNQVREFRSIEEDNAIVMILDGDDCLVNDNNIFNYYNSLYDSNTEFTYGSCWSMADNIPLISQPYPEIIKKNKDYRNYHFNWILPYTHFRTFRKKLINGIDDTVFKNSQGQWYKAGGDGSIFYALIESADPDKVKCLQEIVYNYNDMNPLNDYKVNGELQNRNAREIVKKMNQEISTETNKISVQEPKKKILIAIPTARNIEVETFKAIYDLEIPEGYQTTFQYFYGYNIDQIRNLIADWVVKGFDYLFSVDSDIAFDPDTLKKLLAHDKDIVSGLYIQRKLGQHILEIYEDNQYGGVSNIGYSKIKGRGLVPIAGCGFGCVLVKSKVMRDIGYPQFRYHSALDHRNTVSEDVDFCKKARNRGFEIFADTTILCRHIGQTTFLIDNTIPAEKTVQQPDIKQRLRDLGSQRMMPQSHVQYLHKLKEHGFYPKVIYDIGACVLHWTDEAVRIWPAAEYVVFEAMDSCEFLYQEKDLKYHIGVLSDVSGKDVDFYQNDWHPGGNSYYRENSEINPEAANRFNESHKKRLKTVTLDAVARLKKFPPPDLIKMDIQGAELDVLKGAGDLLDSAQHVILELQKVEYNKGAPLKDSVILFMESQGFECKGLFCDNGPDGDYHFVRK